LDEVQEDAQLWAYSVLETNVDHKLSAIGQLCRNRRDCLDLGFCQNVFDLLKNQWSWGGLTTQGMHRSELTVRADALISCPQLLTAMGHATHPGGRAELHHLTPRLV
jgi:hypothetical protein